jgi:predicted aspartyl protease
MTPSTRWLVGGVAHVVLLMLAGAATVERVEAGSSPGVSFPLAAGGSPVTVPVHIGERGPFEFVLDSGATLPVIDESLAQELELPITGTTEVGSPLGEGNIERPTVLLSGAAIGELRLPHLEAATLDLGALFGHEAAPRGVLGVGALANHVVTFDFAASRLDITPGALPEPDGQTVWEYPSEPGIPELPLDVAGHPVLVHVDTGSPGYVTLPLEMAARLPLEGQPIEVGRGGTVDRTFTIHAAALAGAVTAGAIRIEQPRLNFIDGIPCGIVGRRFLSGYVLTLDPTRHRLRLTAGLSEAGEQSAPEPRRVVVAQRPKRYGIRFFQHDASPMPVAGVDEGSPADAAGLQAGDQIVEINGRPVEELGPAERAKEFHGSPLQLVVLRDGQRLTLTMALE